MSEFQYGTGEGMSIAEKETDPVTSEDALAWETANDTSDTSDTSEAAAVDPSTMTKVSVDWTELEGALENNSPDLHSFLNSENGEVIRVFRGSENAEDTLRHMENSSEFVYIEPISSREQYRWMEEYIEATPESPLKDKLNIAVDGKGAFRRFKDVLVGYPEDRERWFVQRSQKLRVHITEWLKVKNIFALNLSEWQEPTAERNRELSSRASVGIEGDAEPNIDLRLIAHELVDLISSRELPSAVAFLEFLRARRSIKRSRFNQG